MYSIKEYIRVKSAEEAYELVKTKKAVILGGMHWLKMQKSIIPIAVDISDIGLNTITEYEDRFVIGAGVSLRTLETDTVLNSYTNNAFADAFGGIVGVQFRNTASLGGSIALRGGFSDVVTLMLALDATLHFYDAGDVSLEDYLKEKRYDDLLMSVTIPKAVRQINYRCMRLNATDFSVINVAVAKSGNNLRIAVGARPATAKLLVVPDTESDDIGAFAEEIAAKYNYESNMRGSKEYRRHLAGVLIARAMEALRQQA